MFPHPVRGRHGCAYGDTPELFRRRGLEQPQPRRPRGYTRRTGNNSAILQNCFGTCRRIDRAADAPETAPGVTAAPSTPSAQCPASQRPTVQCANPRGPTGSASSGPTGSEAGQRAQRELRPSRQGQRRATSPQHAVSAGTRRTSTPPTPRARGCPPTLRPQGVPAARRNTRQPAPAGPGQRRPGGRSPRKRVTRPESDQPARC